MAAHARGRGRARRRRRPRPRWSRCAGRGSCGRSSRRRTRPRARACWSGWPAARSGDDDGGALELEAARERLRAARRGAGPRPRRLAHPARRGRRPHGLTPRELEVLRLVAAGQTQQGDRRRARPQRADGRPAREQHLRQAGRLLARRRHGLRVRAPARLSDACGSKYPRRRAAKLGGSAEADRSARRRVVGGRPKWRDAMSTRLEKHERASTAVQRRSEQLLAGIP